MSPHPRILRLSAITQACRAELPRVLLSPDLQLAQLAQWSRAVSAPKLDSLDNWQQLLGEPDDHYHFAAVRITAAPGDWLVELLRVARQGVILRRVDQSR